MGKEKGKTGYKTRFILLTVIFAAAFFLSCVLGRYSISPGQFFGAILSRFVDIPQTWPSAVETVLFEIRLPRVVMGVFVGASLSLAGLSYQGMFRNPMVSPDILGASAGAGFGAALAILMGFGYFAICTNSFLFGILAVALAYISSRLARGDEILGMILSGIIISSLFSAGTSFIKLVADTQEQLPEITYWLMGSLTSVKKQNLYVLIPIVISAAVLFMLRWRMNLLTIDEESADTMGINLKALRFAVVICATLLTSSCVAVTGMIGWVGLVIPHFCRMLFGYDYKRLVPASLLFGGAFMVIVDDIARLPSTREIPIGILTSFVGAPLLFYLLVTGGARRD